jgi:hypothetical protein
MELETKAVEHSHEIKQAFDEFMGGFEAFKQDWIRRGIKYYRRKQGQ